VNKFERTFDSVCNRFQLNPGNWLPHIKPDGIYEMGTSYDGAESMLDEDGNLREGTKVPIECFSIYGAFWTICYSRRQQSGRERSSRWEKLWSFLSDVDMGVYDTTNWVPVEDLHHAARIL
jgi:hypothetical protein